MSGRGARWKKEIRNGTYRCEFAVRVEALPNAKGFIPMGEGRLVQEENGFTLSVQNRELFFDHSSRESVQTEYKLPGQRAVYCPVGQRLLLLHIFGRSGLGLRLYVTRGSI